MKLDDKKILDIVYTLLGILFFNVKKLCIFLGVNLKGFNYSTHVSDKNLIKKGLNYRRKPNYFDVDLSSSGTTGEPTTVWASPLHWISEQSAQMEYFSNNDYCFRDKMVIVRGYAPKEGEHFIKRDKLRNFVWISPFHLNTSNINLIINELSGKYFLRGYPSSLELLSNLLNNHKVDAPVACFTASETLSSYQRAVIENKFACKVYDWYGTSEPSVLMFQDKESYPFYKTPLFHCKVKFIKHSINEHKILGCSIWDTLSNIGYYDTDDIVILKDNKVLEIKGRNSDFLILDNLNIPVTNFLTVFYSCTGISRFQIVNFSDVLLFIIQPSEGFVLEELDFQLKKRLVNCSYLINDDFNFIQSGFGKTPHFINLRTEKYVEYSRNIKSKR